MIASNQLVEPTVIIVVLNWNKWKLSLECIDSLQTLSYTNWKVLLVDNGSTDGSMQKFASLPERVTVISLPDNLGYTGGNNMAIERAIAAGADYVWLLNNDAKVEKDTLSHLVDLAESNPRVGLAGPLLMHPGSTPSCEAAGVRFDCGTAILEVTTDTAEAESWQAESPERMAVYGTGLLIRRALIEKIGGFDPTFFAYDEDIDLSIRSAKAGFLNVVNFKSILWHEARQKTAEDPQLVAPYVYYYMTRNDIKLWRKHCSTKLGMKAQVWTVHKSLKEVVKLRREGRGAVVVEAFLRGIWDGSRGHGGPYVPGRRAPEPVRSALLALGKIWI